MAAEVSHTLLWQGRRGLWAEWLATLPEDVAAELRRIEAKPAHGAWMQAAAEAAALDAKGAT